LRILIAIVFLGCAAAGEPIHKSTGTLVDGAQRTHWGHVLVSLDLQNNSVNALWGTVRVALKDPVEGVLVEVYSRHAGDSAPRQTDGEVSIENRVGACITGAAGNYAFDLPSGHYEIRATKRDWNPTSALIVVDVRKGKKTATQIPLEVGN
jgi:hypothetical protein